jgi:phosphoglycolate phosphatase
VIDPGRPRPPRLDPRGVRAFVFDLDGTLIDSYPAIAASLNYARSVFDLPPLSHAQVRRRVGRGLEVLIEEQVGAGHVEEGVRLFRERYAEVYAGQTSSLPGALETLRWLHGRGFRMAVASNKPARFAEPILRDLGMLRYLKCVMGPDVAGATKPHPAMIRRCLEVLRVAASEAVYVGDMVLDVQSAARAGLPVLLVPGGSSSLEQLEATGETVLDSLGSLCTMFAEGGRHKGQ